MSPTSASSTVTHPPSGTKRALDDDGGDLMRDDPPALERQSHVSPTTSTVTVRSEPSVAPSAKTAVMNSHAAANSTTNFRNVSACNRCRNRKNRCDQKLPRCTGCAKANVKCVGFDPVSKRQIPRSYVYYLETRVKSLEALLQTNGIACPPPSDDFSISETIKPGINVPYPPEDDDIKPSRRHVSGSIDEGDMASALNDQDDNDDEQMMDPALHDDGSYGDPPRVRRAANAGATASASLSKDNRTSHHNGAIPFSRVVFAAVRSSVPQSGSEKSLPQSATRAPQAAANSAGGSSSFFALHTKSTVDPAPFPEKAIGQRLVDLYFEYTNPQLPILHRPEFNALFERVYATEASQRTPRELYLMNMVFAIGSGIIMDSSTDQSIPTMESALDGSDAQNRKRMRVTSRQYQPEEYHASAIVHLDSFLGTSPAAEGVGGGLEELQAVLLLAALALLRPFAPGLWYIIGVAVRLAIDLGLHCEDNDVDLDRQAYGHLQKGGSRSKGRRQWTRDLRRRLWWSTFSLDRLVSTCVGRPVGMTEQVVTTAFPSLLDDKYVSPSGFLRPPREIEGPSYKVIARHYFRLRLLQSEILQVLQHRQAEQARIEQITADGGWTKFDHYIRTDLPSPFLSGFHSFRDWRFDVDRRLWEWKESAPKQHDTGVAFTPLFLELNYWQAVILLYRQSLAVPEPLAEEMSPAAGDMASPNTAEPEAKEDEQMVFMKVAQAGQTVLKIYRQLHRLKLVNYTFLSTHHLFMSGISFLYAIWHSELVRSQVTLDDVDFTVLIATSVLTDLIEKCPPAEACRDAFVRMSKATISMCMSTTGFGTQSTLGSQPLNSPGGYFSGHAVGRRERTTSTSSYGVPMPKFDMNLKDLFSDEEIANRPFNLGINLRDPVFGPSGIGPYKLPIPPDAVSSTSMELEPTPQRMPTASISPELAYHVPYQRQQPQPQPQPPAPAPAAEGLGGTLAPEAMNLFQPLDNLDAVFASDDSNDQSFWSQMTTLPNSNDFDLGFGTGGYDNTWEEGVNLDLFDGLFFGNASAANGGQGHAPDAGSGKEPASEAET